jgi:hypothetical protein
MGPMGAGLDEAAFDVARIIRRQRKSRERTGRTKELPQSSSIVVDAIILVFVVALTMG